MLVHEAGDTFLSIPHLPDHTLIHTQMHAMDAAHEENPEVSGPGAKIGLGISQMIIHSRIGSTDCSGCEIYRKGTRIFAKPTAPPGQNPDVKFISLPLRVAQLPTPEIADIALDRIIHALNRGEACVSLEDLERYADSS